ncbi:MAG TPA: aminotransferase class V-fold PLP-dependent enzyme [Symbiobacteriaceae bacterium]|nr:aminotransferase class V-fold PLP-dependent enzyme [Symbiobacteriaceae bacterium]
MEAFDLGAMLERQLRPYRGLLPTMDRLPAVGRSPGEILAEVAQLHDLEAPRWKAGYSSGAVYHGDDDHVSVLNQVYALHSQSNPLHPDLWPSAVKFESEIVAMTARMLGGEPGEVVGTVSSGGTESILLAMKAYRDWARAKKGIQRPEAVVPITAHAAFWKAAQYFGIELVPVPVTAAFSVDVAAVRAAITPNTTVIVGSAPAFPHGIIDPIAELAAIAQEHGVGCHVDACLGGFLLPWAGRLGYPVPAFDFRVPGVTSISADTHKYGYAAKGASVILYRDLDLLHHQYFTIAGWPGGLYMSPTFAGSRPGALSATCWAALVAMGESGYIEAARRILSTADVIKAGIRTIPGLRILGDPLWVIAFASDEVNIYQVMERMGRRGWSLNGLQNPAAVHIALTLRHTQPGVAERFLADLAAAVAETKANPEELMGMAPIYGMAAQLPGEMVDELLRGYLDLMFKV